MYTSIKAFNEKSFLDFYHKVGGTKKNIDNKIVFDTLYFEKNKITFYKNLNILFNGVIDEKLNKLIDIIIDKNLYVGSDEVGVGESIGPLVAAAVKFKSYNDKKAVILNGIKDSKKLNAEEIYQKANFIKKHCEYQTITLTPLKFNEIYKKNSNVKAINAIIQNELHKKFEYGNFIHVTDQFVNKKKYDEYIELSKNKKFKGDLLLLTKAEEKYLEVSAAAIIAKDIFNNWVLNEFKNDGIEIKVDKRLRSWDIYQDLINGKYKVKDKSKYIKNWNK